MSKVYLNFGHGGNDPGATGNGLKEKDLTKKIGEKVASILKDYDVQVKTFQQSGSQTLKHITDDANKWNADVFVSFHINAGGGTGFESYIYNGNVSGTTKVFQNDIHNETMKAIRKYNVKDRGAKTNNFHVLRETKMIAVLSETLFIDNKTDAALLKQDAFITDVARGHAQGIIKYLKLKKKSGGSTSKPDTSKEVYRVQVGAFKDKRNADEMVKKLKKDGYETYMVKG